MCCWETNWSQKKDKGTTAAGQARLEGLCPPARGRALAPRQKTQTQTERKRPSVDAMGEQNWPAWDPLVTAEGVKCLALV